MAASTGQNDSGRFQLDFRVEKYLPFEGAGAISRWRIELPRMFRSFNYDTISDIVLHLKYTARRDEMLAGPARAALQTKLDAAGEGTLCRFFSLRHSVFARDAHFSVIMAEVSDIDVSQHTVLQRDGSLPYDTLIIATYERLGLHVSYGGPNAAFTTMRATRSVINLRHAPQGSGNHWSRVILRVRGVDALYQHLRAQGLHPSTPKNAAWGERYCEMSAPDGDVISFAALLETIHEMRPWHTSHRTACSTCTDTGAPPIKQYRFSYDCNIFSTIATDDTRPMLYTPPHHQCCVLSHPCGRGGGRCPTFYLIMNGAACGISLSPATALAICGRFLQARR